MNKYAACGILELKMANGDQIKAMLRAYKEDDEKQVVTLALQIAAKEAKAGHVNLAAEISKSGFSEEEILRQWAQLKSLPSLNIVGLMTMPPVENSAEKNRVYFRKLKTLGAQLNLRCAPAGLGTRVGAMDA